MKVTAIVTARSVRRRCGGSSPLKGHAPLALVLFSAFVSATQATEPSMSAAAQVVAIGNDYVAARLDALPELVYLGLGGRDAESRVDHGALADNSPEGLARGRQLEDTLLARLDTIEAEALRKESTSAWVLWVSLREQLDAARALRVCRGELWSLNHMSGWQTLYPRVARGQPLASAADRSAALRRWSGFPAYIAAQESWLRRGLDAGYSVPVSVVDRVLGQLDRLLTAKPEDSALAAFATRSENAPYRTQALALLRDRILPAVRRHRDFLSAHYRPRARTTLGIDALPEGERCYGAWLRHYTTLPISAQAMFARGSAAVSANRQAVIDAGAIAYDSNDVGEIIHRNNVAPNNRFSSREEFIAYAGQTASAARDKINPYFTSLPKQHARVAPYAEYLAGSGQSSRYERSAKVSIPATFRIATDGWERATRGSTQVLAVHEVWPGHHLQIATANERLHLHPAVSMTANAAYLEGWARYAEALAEEAGVYDVFAKITRRAWPARGMVVDPGIHVFGWSRARAVAFLRESGRFAGEQADVMIDRIAVLPGQLTAYDTGALEITALRQEAEQALGEQFALPAFHDAVLSHGVLPLAALRGEVQRWVGAQAHEHGNVQP
ncbi:MAG: DUF885 domain-containing protein [Pseudomonadota bacterium]